MSRTGTSRAAAALEVSSLERVSMGAPPSRAQLVAHYGEQLDLGSGVSLSWLTDESGHLIGFACEHPRAKATAVNGLPQPTGSPCAALGLFDIPANARRNRFLYRVVSWLPLTLRPSMRCRVCGHQGFVTESRWVPAS